MSQLFKGLEQIEEAREQIRGMSFMTDLFLGHPQFSWLVPSPEAPEEQRIGEAYCEKVSSFLQDHVNPEEIERNAKIPDAVLAGLFDLGAFSMKIPKEYGGLGFSYKNYGRVLTLIAGWSNVLSLTVAVPQSIGIAMPILLFGNEEQKRTYLPRIVRNEISAFALTEPLTGSDAANVRTEAVLDTDGKTFLLNGEKLWCTNGPIAGFLTLIARVPAKKEYHQGKIQWRPTPKGEGADRAVHTAFIVDMHSPGITIEQRCQFEGCRGIENGYMTFRNVHIPADHVIGDIGKGLRYALTILNIGRAISIPAICLGMAKQAWQPTLDRANSRVTFQKPLGERHTQQKRIGLMAADLFAMEALSNLVWHLADQNTYDIRIEAAIAKIACSEKTIQFLRDAQIIFGGLGYETAASKGFRGEPAFGIEQLVRDVEMYRIGEGATDILRPFVAREALNPHLERAKAYLDERLTPEEHTREMLALFRQYLPHFWEQWKRKPLPERSEFEHPRVRRILMYAERASRRLARAILSVLALHQERLRDDQGRQNRIETVGEDILIMAATALHAVAQERTQHIPGVWDLVDEVFREARKRIDRAIPEIIHNEDMQVIHVGKRALQNHYPWLTKGVIPRSLKDYLVKEKRDSFEK